MDRTRFDNVTRLLAKGENRRAVLKGMVGGAVGVGVISRIPTPSALAQDTCIAHGEACEMVDGAIPCCDSPCYSCFEGTCDYGGGRGSVDPGCACETDVDCYLGTCVESVCEADEVTCIAPGDACLMEEGATPCCGCYTCFEAICDNPKGCFDADCACESDSDCCDELTCIDGACGTPSSGGGTGLPDTGTGSGSGNEPWLAAAVIGGAAVVASQAVKRSSCASRESNQV